MLWARDDVMVIPPLIKTPTIPHILSLAMSLFYELRNSLKAFTTSQGSDVGCRAGHKGAGGVCGHLCS